MLPTPLQPIEDKITRAAGVQLLIKRDDLIHPQISGNKWRKLTYNLQEADKLGKDTLLTFGGAYSNHLYAVAAAGKQFGLQTIGVVRGEETLPLNSTLAFVRACGMQVHYADRVSYREKEQSMFVRQLLAQTSKSAYVIPEGGSNALAVRGVAETIGEIAVAFDYVCCACGTGGTLAGLVAGLNRLPATERAEKKALGFAVLKGGQFLYDDVKQLLTTYASLFSSTDDSISRVTNWEINLDYHFGGYAAITPALLQFIRTFEQQHHVLLEQVYTGKLFFGVYDLLQRGFFKRGETIVALHTGGLQGRSPALGEKL